MVKKLVVIIFFTYIVSADFIKDCTVCHIEKRVDLRKTFMNALIVYGGENNFKTALFYYCKNPQPMTSVMSEEFLKKYMPLKVIQIDDLQLKEDIDEYWRRYKIKENLK